MKKEIEDFNSTQSIQDKVICDLLASTIVNRLPEAENKIWHSHPVWFLDGNPIVGYSKEKKGIRLMFWSGIDFDEVGLEPSTGKFKDASKFYTSVEQVDVEDLNRWLEKSKSIQWDYKNIVKRKGELIRIK